ncbi:MAG: CRISPR-associated endonuclease Cas1, partial [Mariprofundaceae bacterium]|nr:CRISPR-associated endonuclease Cas1 [Mariprofundaceae bacterium]
AWDREKMLSLAARLLRGEYRPPALNGFVHEDADGGLRPLAAPPFTDRVLQRAVHQTITPALDAIMADSSYGYRAGRSRFQVRDLIQMLYREGYRWVFESDIHSFFDTVSWKKLRVRLTALLGNRQLTDAVMAWMQAPVSYRGSRIERDGGLPQGSPLSPVLANLMLDDFDHDLRDAGCKLIRFADDFVIVAKTRQAAMRGGELAEKALRDAGLMLNREKTRVVPFSQGFRFLGFLFVDGMAVECRPQRSEDAGRPPPQSWLARAMSPDSDESARDELLRGDAPAPVSPYENRGQMLVFCGEPAMLFTRGGRARIEREDECLFESPWSHLDGIVLFGRHHVTTPALFDALAHDVPIHLATGSGHYRGMVFNPRCASSGELWISQHRLFSDEGMALRAAISVVDARIRHMRETLRRRAADTRAALNAMNIALRETEGADSRKRLNGIEGNASKCYFQALRELVPEDYGFHGRVRRPPTDPFNALLSLGYTHLYAHIDTLLRAESLLPEKGFYHQPRSGHAALASDLMEPFRHIVERCALSMVQRGRLGVDDFSMQGEKGCRMTAAGRRVYLASLSAAMLASVRAAGGGESLPVLDHMHRQVLALKMWIAGKAPRFSAWRMR